MKKRKNYKNGSKHKKDVAKREYTNKTHKFHLGSGLMCSPTSFNDNIEIGISSVLDLRIGNKAWKCCANIPVDKVFYN